MGLVLLAGTTVPLSGTTTHDSTVAGAIVAPGTSTLAFEGRIAGALSGELSLVLSASGINIESGRWWLVATSTDADGSTQQVGTLSGAVGQGGLVLNTDGSAAGLSTVQLTVTEGTGMYSGVGDGSGSLDGTFTGTNFNGTFKVTF